MLEALVTGIKFYYYSHMLEAIYPFPTPALSLLMFSHSLRQRSIFFFQIANILSVTITHLCHDGMKSNHRQ